MYTVGIITISDKGAAGRREDKSGPKISFWVWPLMA